jgi:hypothetical protein
MKPPPAINPPPHMTVEERMRVRLAAHRIQRMLPGPIGEHLADQLLFWEDCAYRFEAKAKAAKLIAAIEEFEVVYAGPAREQSGRDLLHDQIDQIIGQWLDTQLALTGVPSKGVSVWERAQRALLTRLRTGPLGTYSQKLTPRIVQLLTQKVAA